MTTSNAAPMVCVPVEFLSMVYGMAREGCESPTAAYRWCERIDELFHGVNDDYNEYARILPEALAAAPAPQPVQGEAADLIARLKVAGKALVRERKVYWEDLETLLDVIAALEAAATQPPAPAVGDGADTECRHAETVPSYDYTRCVDCGAVHTDSGWGIAKNMWFASIDAAQFFKKTGRLPEATPAVQIAAPGDVERLLAKVYADAYHAGHHGTVEGGYIDVLPVDRDTYWLDHVGEEYSAELRAISAALRSQGQADAVVTDAMVDCGLEAWHALDTAACFGWVSAQRARMSAALTAALAQQANKEQSA